MTLTPIQQLILQAFVIEPEDKTAFKRAQATERARKWAKKYPARVKENCLRAYARRGAEIREKSAAWYREHREYAGERNLRRYRDRVRSDPAFRVLVNLRKRIWDAVVRGVGGIKSARTRELLDCTIPEFRAHLEKHFKPGMTWENYGPVWHIDHIKPCASFDLLDPAQQRACFHWSNQQPLFAEENQKKGAR